MDNDEILASLKKGKEGFFKKCLQGLRFCIGLALLYWALKGANWVDLKEVVLTANLSWLLIALALVLASTFLKIVRWFVLLKNYGLSRSTFRVARAFLVGQAANILLPFRGGEVIRAGMLAQADVVQTSQIISTIMIEKSLDLFALTLVTLAVLPYLQVISNRPIIRGLVFFSVLALVLLILFMMVSFKFWPMIKRYINHRPRHWKTWLSEKIDQFVASSYWMRDMKKVLPAMGLTLGIWVLMWLINLPVFRSVNLPAYPILGLFILVLVYIGLIPAMTPGNIAPFYFFAQLGLVTFKVPQDQALAFAILLHAVVTLPVLLLGGISLLIQNRGKEKNWQPQQSL